ncbi:peptide/nickel transport system permease protein [Nakamurella panacisegetis]|uniref:Peptide/nickel transport system permease protein n=1 Tax=Nakamurella panacisegetis TaxID=1090615 RepID=A0A1H0N6I8_9ACTN|nr:ABC transporter permease [Nakamurella panacisegetis]SDO88241.1 peptide/nickel transport system permease protein [Nakamurella panacisegetis]
MLGKLIARRLALAVLTIVLATVLVFVALQALPGNLATQILGKDATPDAVAQLTAQLHLDRPGVLRYLSWLGGAVHGDFGTSLATSQRVVTMAGDYLRNTAVLAGITIVVGITLALILGVVAGLTRDRLPDVLISGVALVAMSVPEFTLATLLVLVFAVKLAWFPAVVTDGPDAPLSTILHNVPLPAAALSIVMAAYIVRMMRTSVIDVMASEYVAMATLRGLPRRRVLLHHALPNALLPALNVIAINIAWLVGGVVVVEAVFNYPGIGTLMLDAVHNRDVPVLQYIAVIGALVYVVSNLLADLAATALNPRLRTPARAS